MKYEFVNINPLDPTFSPLIPESIEISKNLIAVGAMHAGSPIGICLARCTTTRVPEVTVLHLFVLPEHRNHHVGRQLLANMQSLAQQQGGQYFFLVYPESEPTTPALKKILEINQWKSRPYMIRCLFNGFTFDMPWVHEEYHYPPDFEEFAWTTLTAEERKDLLHRQTQKVFSPTVSPFHNETKIEPLNSLGLRYQGRVVGWMLTHRIAPDTICYKALYVERGLEQYQLAPKLIFNSIRRHMQARTQWAILEIPLLYIKGTWKRFVLQRIVPYADKVTHISQAWFVVF